jgi:hypothetical protein
LRDLAQERVARRVAGDVPAADQQPVDVARHKTPIATDSSRNFRDSDSEMPISPGRGIVFGQVLARDPTGVEEAPRMAS